jgi:hypothetical protein
MALILRWLLVNLDALGAIAGLGVLVAGVALIHIAAALIVAGVGMIAFSLLPIRRGT